MKRPLTKTFLPSLLACGLVATLTHAAPQKAKPKLVEVGDHPEHTFRRPLIRGMEVTSLADLRGRPVLVQFWYHGWQIGVDDTMKLILALQAEFEDDLQVVFANRRLKAEKTERMLLEKGWLGTTAMWTDERPFLHGDKYEPHFVLLSATGEVVMKSRPLVNPMDIIYSPQLMDDLEEAVAREVERLRDGPPDAPAPVRKAYRDFAKGKVAKALAGAREAAAGAGDDPLQAAANAALQTFEQRIEKRLARAAWLIDHGSLAHAELQLEPLVGQLAESPEGHAQLTALQQRIGSEELAAERKADKALASLEKQIFTKGTSGRSQKSLAKVGRRHAGTKRGAEAERLSRLLEDE